HAEWPRQYAGPGHGDHRAAAPPNVPQQCARPATDLFSAELGGNFTAGARVGTTSWSGRAARGNAGTVAGAAPSRTAGHCRRLSGLLHAGDAPVSRQYAAGVAPAAATCAKARV